ENAQPQRGTRRIARIVRPYARAVARRGVRHRVRDLAILSLELRKFLDAGQWERFLARYRAVARELGGRQLERIGAERIARAAARAGHRTRISAAVQRAKRRFRRSRVGEWVTGHRYRESD